MVADEEPEKGVLTCEGLLDRPVIDGNDSSPGGLPGPTLEDVVSAFALSTAWDKEFSCLVADSAGFDIDIVFGISSAAVEDEVMPLDTRSKLPGLDKSDSGSLDMLVLSEPIVEIWVLGIVEVGACDSDCGGVDLVASILLLKLAVLVLSALCVGCELVSSNFDLVDPASGVEMPSDTAETSGIF